MKLYIHKTRLSCNLKVLAIQELVIRFIDINTSSQGFQIRPVSAGPLNQVRPLSSFDVKTFTHPKRERVSAVYLILLERFVCLEVSDSG